MHNRSPNEPIYGPEDLPDHLRGESIQPLPGTEAYKLMWGDYYLD